MKKFLLALVLMVPMLAFTGCGNDDEPNTPQENNGSANYSWIKNELVGEWECYRYFNSMSGIWVSTPDYVDFRYDFHADGSVDIYGYNSGSFHYQLSCQGNDVILEIDGISRSVLIRDKNKKEIELGSPVEWLRKIE